MSDHLPARVEAVAARIQEPATYNNGELRKELIAWGQQLLDDAYPCDAFHPQNYARKRLAQRQWDRLVTRTDQLKRQAMMTADVQMFEMELDQRIKQRQWAWERSRRVQDARDVNDETIRVQTTLNNHGYAWQERLQQNQHAHEQAMQGQSLAHEREMVARTHHPLLAVQLDAIERAIKQNIIDAGVGHLAMLDAVLKVLRQQHEAPDVASIYLNVLKRVNNDIIGIEAEPRLSDDQKHRQIELLMSSLPGIMTDALRSQTAGPDSSGQPWPGAKPGPTRRG